MTNPEKPENIRERQSTFRDRMRDKGFVQFNVWVKKENVEKLTKYVEKLKKVWSEY